MCVLHHRFLLATLLVLLAVPATAGREIGATTESSANVLFTDVSAAAGVDVFLSTGNGHSLGVNWLDFNNDGWPDLFAVGGNPQFGLNLFQNDGDGTFTDVSDTLLPSLDLIETTGSVFADYDNDGDVDIYVYTDNPELAAPQPADGPPNLLLKNLWSENGGAVIPGQPLFEEVAAAAGVDDLADVPFGPLPGYRAKTANFLDYDRDGCVDLYVGHWVMRGGADNPANRDRLFRNNCDGTFTETTDESGMTAMGSSGYRPALASIGALLNDDLWPDLYIVHATPEVAPRFWDFNFRNNGDGTFTEIFDNTPGIGSDTEAGMGIDVADIDLDGDWDIYMSDLYNTSGDDLPRGNAMYLCNPDGSYVDNVAVETGTVSERSWGVNFFDADQDGDEDLFVATMNGTVSQYFYDNNGDGTFTNIAGSAGVTDGNARGSAVADFDRDGDLDFAVANVGSTLQLFRNDSTGVGNRLQFDLHGIQSNASAINTLVTVDAGGIRRMRQVKGGSSGHGQDDLAVHFGLGSASVADLVTVQWPSGDVDILSGEAVNRRLPIAEGSTPAVPGRRMNAGGEAYLTTDTALYPADRAAGGGHHGFVGGGTHDFGFAVHGTDDDPLYASVHYGSNFTYTDPQLPAGAYLLTLHFMEPYYRDPGKRLQDITVEGLLAFDDYDIFVESGGRRFAHSETIRVDVDGDGLQIGVASVVRTAILSGIDVQPIVQRMNGGGPATDLRNGEAFLADTVAGPSAGFTGGAAAILDITVHDTADRDFYRSIHYGGNFSFSAPGLAQGTYEVQLHFVEPYFGPPGKRLFDVAMEGVVVLDDYDIRVAAGGRRRPVVETLTVDVVDGTLDIDFSVVRSAYAIVSGISVRALELF